MKLFNLSWCPFSTHFPILNFRIINGLKRIELDYVCFVYDATKEPGFKGPGAHLPELKKEMPRGLDLYPFALSYPEKPIDFIPSIVMMISEFHSGLKFSNKIAYIYDQRVSRKNYELYLKSDLLETFTTFFQLNISQFLMKIESRMNFVCICQGKRHETEKEITSYMIDIATHLRMNKAFACIRPNYKS